MDAIYKKTGFQTKGLTLGWQFGGTYDPISMRLDDNNDATEMAKYMLKEKLIIGSFVHGICMCCFHLSPANLFVSVFAYGLHSMMFLLAKREGGNYYFPGTHQLYLIEYINNPNQNIFQLLGENNTPD